MKYQHPVMALIATCVFTLVIAACGGGGSSARVSPTDVTGLWRGTTQDSIGGAGQLFYSITQQGAKLSGNWGVTYPNPILDNAGTVFGNISGATVQMTFAPASPDPCMTFATGTLNAAANQTSGTYNRGTCPNQQSGTFVVDKQSGP